jgi:hypothetical protein
MRAQVWRMAVVAVALMALASAAAAQVTTERSASILVFPRVIADGTRDTIIQITNTSNSMVHAHCFYVNGALTFPDLPPGPINPPLWTEVDFDIWLTKQQPTHWVVSEGRLVDPTDPPCSNNPPVFDCNGAGTDPGRVPPVVEGFRGELKCIEVDAVGAPVSGNHLKGEATTVTSNVCDPFFLGGACYNDSEPCRTSAECADTFDVSKYNAIGIIGNENNDGDNVLCLGGEPSDACRQGAEYDACPQFWIANHLANDAPDPVAGDGSEVFTKWAVVPCTENFETQNPETVTIFIETWNEFEQAFSSFATVTCWDDLFLDQINPVTFEYNTLGSSFAQSRLRPTSQTQSGFLMVSFEEHMTDSGNWTYAENNLHVEGARPGPDVITIPAEQVAAQ